MILLGITIISSIITLFLWKTVLNKIFIWACSRGHLNFAIWLYNSGSIDIIQLNGHPDKYSNLFYLVCEHGELDVARWLWSFENSRHELVADIGIMGCCEADSQHLVLLQWLLSLYPQDIPQNEAFIMCCASNFLILAKCLYGSGTIDIHTNDDVCFRHAVGANKDMALWLLSIDRFSEVLINDLSWGWYHKNIIAVLYNQKYKATHGRLGADYSAHILRRIKYYKVLMRVIGRLNKTYLRTCEQRYKYGGAGYGAAYTNFKTLTSLRVFSMKN